MLCFYRCSQADSNIPGTDFKYTYKSCKNLCKQLTVSDACNCTSISYLHSVHTEQMSDKTSYCLFAFKEPYAQKTLENTLCEYVEYVSNANISNDKCNCY